MRRVRYVAKPVSQTVSIISMLLATVVVVTANLEQPPPRHTGALGEMTCSSSIGCHTGYPLNTGPGGISAGVLGFSPPDTYLVGVSLPGTPGQKWGFQATAFTFGGDTSLPIVLVDTVRTQLFLLPDTSFYVSHTSAGTIPIASESIISWQFQIVAPPLASEDAGCPAIFVAGVAANGDSLPTGDFSYTKVVQLVTGGCGCPILTAGDVNASGYVSSADIIAVVGYVFKGNVSLSPCPAAADVNCSGTVTSADIIRLVNYVFKGEWVLCDPCNFSILTWDC